MLSLAVSEDPREASPEQVGYATYDARMLACTSQRTQYVDRDCCSNPEHLFELMKLRLGSHCLISVVTGLLIDGGIACAHRYCRKCMECEFVGERPFMVASLTGCLVS